MDASRDGAGERVVAVHAHPDDELVNTLKADPLLSQIPAVQNDAIVRLPSTPLGTAANPTPLSISYVLDDYLAMLAEAADKAE